ncbi:hypothetical protein ZS_23 [Salmonella phage vB_STM-ZS]|uniref:Uncharacterized protein n=1 Tax=Salmonella phage vB_STM-ZS TaxID=2834247 RepID=A0A8E7FX69_9CAUD|nr:hypothetical protein PF622_gp23 [Salmonella phage vB_STM-ZS]QVW53688.1 hypothetical protein ZS_23 [Salmonella phage vB_STM-ZS]
MIKLTKAQIYTLRRLKSGTKYVMRGDGKKADEQRPDGRLYRPVNAPSVPVLYRLGLLDFVNFRFAFGQPTQYHAVKLTPHGASALEETKDDA